MNLTRFVKRPRGFIATVLTLGGLQAAASPLDEAKVFDWWDNGIVTAEEATEILDLLEEGNQEEACLLAQVYAQESCEDPPSQKGKSAPSRATRPRSPRRTDKTPQGKAPTRPSLTPHGFVDWKGRIDSTGHLESHRTELQVQFYRYTLRLGSQELLAYKNQGSEAYFGDISTRELHSLIPLDTLWGTALLYPLGNFHVAGLLDTTKTTQVRLGYGQRGVATIEAFYWHGFGNGDAQSTGIHSLGLQAKMPFAQVAAWWQYGQEFPLIKIQLYGSEKRGSSNQMKDGIEGAGIVYSWRTTAYIHREDIPRWARLSNTIQKSKYWGSQSLSMRAHDLLDTKVTANAGLISPLDADTMAVRLKLGGESGPEFLRVAASGTCRDAGTNCRVTDWKGGLNASPWELWTLGTSVRIRHTRPEGFASPHLEFFTKIKDFKQSYTKFTLIAPKGRPQDDLRLRTEFLLSGDFLDFSLICTFKGMERLEPVPVRGFAEAKVRF